MCARVCVRRCLLTFPPSQEMANVLQGHCLALLIDSFLEGATEQVLQAVEGAIGQRRAQLPEPTRSTT